MQLKIHRVKPPPPAPLTCSRPGNDLADVAALPSQAKKYQAVSGVGCGVPNLVADHTAAAILADLQAQQWHRNQPIHGHDGRSSRAAWACWLGLAGAGHQMSLAQPHVRWAVARKKDHGKVIWWAELGIRGKTEPPRDCFDVLHKLEGHFPELAGFVFWSDEGFYNVVGNLNGRQFMADPKILTLGE